MLNQNYSEAQMNARFMNPAPTRTAWLLVLSLSGLLLPAAAQVPGLLNYQGRLQASGTNYSGICQFKFALVDGTGGTTYWCQGGVSAGGGEPSGAAVPLALSNGLFSVNLGDLTVSNMFNTVPTTVFTNAPVFLRIWVYDPVRGAQWLSPDRQVTAVGYAMTAATALNVNAANVTGNLPVASVEPGLPSGAMLVSGLAQDTSLLGRGYLPVMSVPAPPWVDGGDGADAPGPRTEHTGIWDGQELIVWGGSLGAGNPWANTGGLYRPDLDAWSPVSLLNPPDARAGHTAVWSGLEMLVWGGNGAAGLLNSGGRYQPGTAKWNVISTTNAPAARAGHVAIWTGTQMLVWGGRNSGGLLGDGAFYTPTLDQWVALNLTNAPLARTGATAVWAGDRILIWGGEGAGGVLNDGGQLLFTNGAAAQWFPMTLSNPPVGRRHHTAVWTGQRLIIWGGDDGSNPLGDGAAYDPIANTWAALSPTNAPAPRYNHTAVWTGQEMLILGGTGTSGELASAAAYSPTTAQWRIAGGGNAQPRAGATAAWSGTEALVFGGQAAGAPMAWLQRLNPQPSWYFYRKP